MLSTFIKTFHHVNRCFFYTNMRNVEIKAKVNNINQLLKSAEEISKSSPTLIIQDDTFYKTEKGRLKLRKFEVSFSQNCVQELFFL